MNLANEESTIIFIPAENIFPHPNNPRKELGDLEELTESIRTNGLLQNLTVTPIPGEEGNYWALIGHRRREAGTQAGLEYFPCTIREGLSMEEQIGIMLEENMLREDLTITEQAKSFQMMLDLGGSIESIADKTGFSQSTIRHRVKLAELDSDALLEKEKDGSFQLNLTDLYQLEKIEDIEEKNKILKESHSSNNLVYNIKQSLINKDRKYKYEKLKELALAKGIQEGSKSIENELYSNKWDTVLNIDLDQDIDFDSINLHEDEAVVFYLRFQRNFYLLKKHIQVLTESEKQEKAKKKQEKMYQDIIKNYLSDRSVFVSEILNGNIKLGKKKKNDFSELWSLLMDCGTYVGPSSFLQHFEIKSFYDLSPEEKQNVLKKIKDMPFNHQLLCLISKCLTERSNWWAYGMTHNSETCRLQKRFDDLLKDYDWNYENEEIYKLLDGTHEIFEKNEKPNEALSETA